jgi:hypothetical protein
VVRRWSTTHTEMHTNVGCQPVINSGSNNRPASMDVLYICILYIHMPYLPLMKVQRAVWHYVQFFSSNVSQSSSTPTAASSSLSCKATRPFDFLTIVRPFSVSAAFKVNDSPCPHQLPFYSSNYSIHKEPFVLNKCLHSRFSVIFQVNKILCAGR